MKYTFKTCPLCGSERIKLVRNTYRLRVGDIEVVVPKLERYECRECGEKLFDYEATKRIEAARMALREQKGRRKRAA